MVLKLGDYVLSVMRWVTPIWGIQKGKGLNIFIYLFIYLSISSKKQRGIVGGVLILKCSALYLQRFNFIKILRSYFSTTTHSKFSFLLHVIIQDLIRMLIAEIILYPIFYIIKVFRTIFFLSASFKSPSGWTHQRDPLTRDWIATFFSF